MISNLYLRLPHRLYSLRNKLQIIIYGYMMQYHLPWLDRRMMLDDQKRVDGNNIIVVNVSPPDIISNQSKDHLTQLYTPYSLFHAH